MHQNLLDIGLFNASISTATLHVTGFDERIERLNRNLDRLNASVHTYISGIGNFLCDSALKYDIARDKEKQPIVEKTFSYADAAVSAGSIVESGLEIYDAISKLSPTAKKIKKGLELFGGAMKAFEGMEALADATGIAAGLAAGSSIMGGAESIAAAASTFGPWGWAAGAATLIAGGAVAVLLNKPKRKIDYPTFADKALENKNDYLLATAKVSTEAEYYIRLYETLQSKSDRQISQEADQLKHKLLKDGGSITFDWKKAEEKDPVYLRGLVAALLENDSMKNKAIKSLAFDDSADMAAFQNRFDKFNHFPLSTNESIAQEYTLRIPHGPDGPGMLMHYTASISRKENQKRLERDANHAAALAKIAQDDVLKQIVETYLSNGFDYVQKEYTEKLSLFQRIPGVGDSIQKVWSRFLNVKKVIDRGQNHENVPRLKETVKDDDSKAERIRRNQNIVTINLNKPMIENFTINTKDTKEALSVFKHKVEEVLIEILNSANAIQ
jgi:hypothetical protein